MILLCRNLDACILHGCDEEYHDWAGFDDDNTCDSRDIPIVGMFTRGLTIGTFPNVLVIKLNEWFYLYLL